MSFHQIILMFEVFSWKFSFIENYLTLQRYDVIIYLNEES